MSPTRNEIKSGVLGSVVAGALLGALLHVTVGSEYMRLQAALYVNQPDVTTGWLAHLFHSVILGVIYAAVVTGYIDPYVDVVVGLTQRSETLSSAFMPIIRRFGMAAVVTTAMGMIFGILVWAVFASLAVPYIVGDSLLRFPNFDGGILLSYVGYGGVLGVLYGIQITK